MAAPRRGRRQERERDGQGHCTGSFSFPSQATRLSASNLTLTSVTQIAKRLAEVAGDTGIPYLQFVVNPDSFSQTTENLFYFSFLVREQKAAIEVDEDEASAHYGDTICCESARVLAGAPCA